MKEQLRYGFVVAQYLLLADFPLSQMMTFCLKFDNEELDHDDEDEVYDRKMLNDLANTVETKMFSLINAFDMASVK